MTDIDYAAIMAAHEGRSHWCSGGTAGEGCLVSQLAADLAEANRKLAAVEALAREPIARANSAVSEFDDIRFENGRCNLAYAVLAMTGRRPMTDRSALEQAADAEAKLAAVEALLPEPKPTPEPIEVGEVVWTDGWR